jgi:hypothetical protein
MSDNNRDNPLIGRDERNQSDAGQNAGAARFGDESLGDDGVPLGRQGTKSEFDDDEPESGEADDLSDEETNDVDGGGTALGQQSSIGGEAGATPSQAEGERGASNIESGQDDNAFQTSNSNDETT